MMNIFGLWFIDRALLLFWWGLEFLKSYKSSCINEGHCLSYWASVLTVGCVCLRDIGEERFGTPMFAVQSVFVWNLKGWGAHPLKCIHAAFIVITSQMETQNFCMQIHKLPNSTMSWNCPVRGSILCLLIWI